jgi:hypothetical protein
MPERTRATTEIVEYFGAAFAHGKRLVALNGTVEAAHLANPALAGTYCSFG